MTSHVTVNKAKPSDLPQMKILISELIDEMTDVGEINVENAIRNCQELLVDPSHQILVARGQGNILGLISFSARRTMQHTGQSGLIDELVISSSCRRSGIGRKLVLAAVDACRNMGCCEIEVSTEKRNGKARKFYKTVGFDEHAVLLEMDL